MELSKSFVLILMIFFHIVDDFYLQGILAQMKQKDWWLKHPQYKNLYKYDYIVALFVHGFSWAFMVMLPIAIFYEFNPSILFYQALIINAMMHLVIDDSKCNKLYINLITDQLLHMGQIFLTFLVLMIWR